MKLVRLMGMLWPTLQLMLGCAVAIVLWVGGRTVLQGKMAVEDFAKFLFYIAQLTWPVIALGWVINIFQRGTASMGRINEILTARPEIDDRDAVLGEVEIRGDIEFRNLTFSHHGTLVLQDVNLCIAAGTSLAIVGPTGSGKTTLVNLIPRIYDAEPGTVLIDGRPIRDYRLATLRREIGFVPQETFLFSDTIRENIGFGAEQATMEEVERAARAANIAHDIEGFPDRYSTMVGERGLTLSGGQKQRTAIARALLRNPRILVLDDALSSVDTQTERIIQSALERLFNGRTSFVIAHRLSTITRADKIVVIDTGRIIEEGTHAELLEKRGRYFDLYTMAFAERN